MTTAIEASQAFMAAAHRLPSLFDLEDAAYQVLALLDTEHDMEPEDIEAARAELALLDQLMMEKTESYVSLIRSLEAMAEARKTEADRMRDRARSAEKHADWLRNRLLIHMQATGQSRVETSRFTLSIRQSPPSVNVVDAAAVPSEYQRTKIEISVDRRSILEDFKKSGAIPPGVEISVGSRLAVS